MVSDQTTDGMNDPQLLWVLKPMFGVQNTSVSFGNSRQWMPESYELGSLSNKYDVKSSTPKQGVYVRLQ